MTKLKVLWLAQYPLKYISDFIDIINLDKEHSFNWLKNLQDKLELLEHIELHIVIVSKNIKESKTFKFKNTTYHVLKGRSFKSALIYKFKIELENISSKIREIQPNLVHVHGTETFYGLISNYVKIPIVMSIQGVMKEIFSAKVHKIDLQELLWFIQTHIEKRIVRNTPYFLVRTQFDSGFVKKINPNAKLFYVWELMNDEFLKPLPTNISRKNQIVFMGGTNVFKGVEIVIKSFTKLKSIFPDYRLIIGGNFSEIAKNKILSKIPNINVSDIEFTGQISSKEIRELLLNSKMFINASFCENSSNAISEAQLSGIPVIATNVGGTPSLVDDGRTGFLIPSKNWKVLYEKMVYLINHYEESLLMAKEARKISEQRHNPKEIVENYLKCYYDISQINGSNT